MKILMSFSRDGEFFPLGVWNIKSARTYMESTCSRQQLLFNEEEEKKSWVELRVLQKCCVEICVCFYWLLLLLFSIWHTNKSLIILKLMPSHCMRKSIYALHRRRERPLKESFVLVEKVKFLKMRYTLDQWPVNQREMWRAYSLGEHFRTRYKFLPQQIIKPHSFSAIEFYTSIIVWHLKLKWKTLSHFKIPWKKY